MAVQVQLLTTDVIDIIVAAYMYKKMINVCKFFRLLFRVFDQQASHSNFLSLHNYCAKVTYRSIWLRMSLSSSIVWTWTWLYCSSMSPKLNMLTYFTFYSNRYFSNRVPCVVSCLRQPSKFLKFLIKQSFIILAKSSNMEWLCVFLL